MWRCFLRLPLIVGMFTGVSASGADKPAKSAPVTYDQVRPVLKKHCVTCHNTERPRGDLDLSTIGAIKVGSGSGPVAVKGKPEESSLFTMPAHLEEPFMPPNSPKIPQRELDLLERWIADGLLEKGDQPGIPTPSVVTKPPTAPTKTTTSVIAPLPHATAIAALAVSPVAPLAAVSGRGQAILLSLTDKKPLRAIDFPAGDVTALRFSRDGRLLLIGGGVAAQSGVVVGVDVASGKTIFEVGDEADTVLAVDITADQRYAALGGPGRTVKIFRTADGQQTATLKKHTDWILAIAFSPDGLLLASSDRFGGVQVWEAESGHPLHTLRGHTGPVYDLAWSPDGDRLLTAGQDGTMRWWDMHRGTAISQFNAEVGGVLSITLAKSEHILSGGRDRRVALWDRAGKKVRSFSLAEEVVKVGITGDGQTAIVGDAAGSITLLALTSDATPIPIALPVDSVLARKPEAVPAKRTAALPIKTPALPSTPSSNSSADLAAAKQAAALAEAAVHSAEEALSRAKATAQALQAIVREKEAATRAKAAP